MAKSRSRKDGIYYESHHIQPTFMGGPDITENQVLLRPREHFVCHQLLCRIVPKEFLSKAYFAVFCFINGKNKRKKEQTTVSSKRYEQIRDSFSKMKRETSKGKGNSFFGRKHTDEFKQWLSENNPAKRPEVRAKMRGPRPGQTRGPHTEERKRNIANSVRGFKHTDEVKARMKEERKQRIWMHNPSTKETKFLNRTEAENLASDWKKGRGPIKT
jgi:hypothetical protein